MGGLQSDGQFRPLESGDPQTVAGYRLAARLGSGGMGTVYLSYTPGGHPIALKTIRPELSEDPEFRRRFRQEVQAAQRVQGLYTAPVIDYDTEGTRPWLATAYVPGPSLAAAVTEHGPLPVSTLLLLIAGVAEALTVIHGAGIVHRDLKPSNVLLAGDGPRVIDFGIARAADATALTGTGVSVGTPAFMSPEQATGQEITPASDVFALGQVAAFAARGSGAYGDGPSHAVLYRIVHEEPDLTGLPEALGFVTRCLAKDPADRPSPAEVIALCQEASPGGLRQSGEWLPEAIGTQITRRVSASAALAAQSAVTTEPPQGPPATAPATQLTAAVPAPPPTAPLTRPDLATPHAAPTLTAPHTPPPATPVASYLPPAPPAAAPPAPWPGAQPQPRRGSRAGVIAAVVAAALAVGVGGGVYLSKADSDTKRGGTSTSAKGSGEHSGPGSATGSTGPSTRPDPKPVTFKGINIPKGYWVRFADSPPKPLHDENGSNARFGDSADFYYDDDAFVSDDQTSVVGSNSKKVVLLNNAEKGSLATCRAETRYAEDIHLSQLSTGSQICVHTVSGHIAVVTYKGAAPHNGPSDYISVDITVWRNAEQPSGDQ
ncbi:serine/threonine-protein kinase [Streptomyces puniciscabiei]|uniref:serine/threonine-protein kinase n=1 Tax=Streptomyces puniciscabiei TaxID=164348 RepID=UPI0037B14554